MKSGTLIAENKGSIVWPGLGLYNFVTLLWKGITEARGIYGRHIIYGIVFFLEKKGVSIIYGDILDKSLICLLRRSYCVALLLFRRHLYEGGLVKKSKLFGSEVENLNAILELF